MHRGAHRRLNLLQQQFLRVQDLPVDVMLHVVVTDADQDLVPLGRRLIIPRTIRNSGLVLVCLVTRHYCVARPLLAHLGVFWLKPRVQTDTPLQCLR